MSDINKNKWLSFYKLLKAYYEHYGNSKIKVKFSTFNGIDYDQNGKNLGVWLSYQKYCFKEGTLSEERIKLLEQVGVELPLIDKWNRNYLLLKAYYYFYGNLPFPENFKTSDGINYDPNGVLLKTWVDYQRKKIKLGELSKEKVDKLKAIGFCPEPRAKNWQENFELLEEHFKRYGNLDNISYTLNEWIILQKNLQKKGKLSVLRCEKLKKIGINMMNQEELWLYRYNILLKCITLHKEIPKGYIKEYKINLTKWLKTQKRLYNEGKLSDIKIAKLKAVGIDLTRQREEFFKEMFELAKAYYLNNGNLNVPINFITINGIDYNSDGKKLGYWLNNLRVRYKFGKLSQDKILELESIGMIWNIRKNNAIVWICENYNISYDINKDILYRISKSEFLIKMAYLNEQKIFYLDNDGRLNKIFMMSYEEILNSYKIDLRMYTLTSNNSLLKIRKDK